MLISAARILCVDDDSDWCQLLEIMLRQLDDKTSVTIVKSFREAAILIGNSSFDLYILDNTLLDGIGTDLCRIIRQTNLDSPVMFYSAMARDIVMV